MLIVHIQNSFHILFEFLNFTFQVNLAMNWFFVIILGLLQYRPSKCILNSNMAKSHSSIIPIPVAQSFWNFAQNTSVSLPVMHWYGAWRQACLTNSRRRVTLFREISSAIFNNGIWSDQWSALERNFLEHCVTCVSSTLYPLMAWYC